MARKMFACLRFVLIVAVLSELGLFAKLEVEADYDNHWAFYYETPCCGHHHLRHHKGKQTPVPYYCWFYIKILLSLNSQVTAVFSYAQ